MAATEPIRDKKQVDALARYYLGQGKLRNYVLIIMGVYTALRISDLLALTWESVYDFDNQQFRSHIYLKEKKTGKPKAIAVNRQVKQALKLYFSLLTSADKGGFLFVSNRKSGNAISRIQAWRIIREAARAVGLKGIIGCHSLRKTFGYHAWKNGVPVAVIMDIYNHSSFAITQRYLGVSQDDRDKVYLSMRFSA